jgi:DNA-binding response OmpR family regulator
MANVGLIMLVDDEPSILRLLELIFRQKGWQAAAYERPEEALDSLSTREPELIVLDLTMPIMDGEEFHQRARDAGFSGPFLILSAARTGSLRSARMGEAFIQKPFDPAHVVQVAADLLDR